MTSRSQRLARSLRSPPSIATKQSYFLLTAYGLSASHTLKSRRFQSLQHRPSARRYYSTNGDSEEPAPERPADAPIFGKDLDQYQKAALDALYGSSAQPHSLPGAPSFSALFVKSLVFAGAELAKKHSRASFLVGGSGESDEFADIGVWLEPGKVASDDSFDARGVLRTLELHDWVKDELQVINIELDTEMSLPPATVELLKDTPAETEELRDMTTIMLQKLEHKKAFYVEGPDTKTLYVLLGKLTGKGEDGWVGLLGLSITSDRNSSSSSWREAITAGIIGAFMF